VTCAQGYSILMMDHTGMLRPKGVPFLAPGMGKGDPFSGWMYVKEVPFQGKSSRVTEGLIFRERYVKGVPIFKIQYVKR